LVESFGNEKTLGLIRQGLCLFCREEIRSGFELLVEIPYFYGVKRWDWHWKFFPLVVYSAAYVN
jgi:hypothetical protein